MQRITGLAACRELGGLIACTAGVCARKSGPGCCGQPAAHRQWASLAVRPARPFTAATSRRLCRRRCVFAGEKHRLLCSQPGADGPSSGRRPAISVVGVPDPITWIRCKVIMFLLDLYFDLDVNSEEFERGVKQALVHVSNKMSRGRYHELKGIVSSEMLEYVEKTCSSLTDAQRKRLAVQTDDIVFVLPEDISVVFDQHGRKFCFMVMRFWILSSHEGPDDPEGTKVFKVASSEDGGPQKKIVTAVYELR
ncbi:m-AAA protease-interacting protein 1, mitochondrial isoform X2 [Archocentrus centrarchus]|uniref:m-AAA protease-interacting protein 1, mitochondrial isoform X2 n=1 Tax=Archocentrus centrarchus TaxID=63155 RepID=UPI0011E9D541|nr:m-AAA protease-interacting protein 1, mitochondrial-like isoform X2 [Archocentrus centrarchus]